MNIVLFYKYMKKNIAPSSLPDTSRQLAHVKKQSTSPWVPLNPRCTGHLGTGKCWSNISLRFTWTSPAQFFWKKLPEMNRKNHEGDVQGDAEGNVQGDVRIANLLIYSVLCIKEWDVEMYQRNVLIVSAREMPSLCPICAVYLLFPTWGNID